MLKIGIIGCGKISDVHASQIKRIAGCEIVAVCDAEELMAKQLAARFDVPYAFSKLTDFLEVGKPDVVHITTPPQSHFSLGKSCLEAGCHIYVEKPFTVNTHEAEELIRLAETKKRKLTVGHDDQFTHATRAMRRLIRDGYLGGAPVHMESYYCYDLGGKSYAQSFLADRNHWVRNLPGQLAQNVISHGICRIAEYMVCDRPQVIAYGRTSPGLIAAGENEIFDELRVIIHDQLDTTAYFTFSSQMQPRLRHFRVYGKKNAIVIDHDQETLICLRGDRYRSYLERFIPPLFLSLQYAGNAVSNVWRFLRNDFHMKAGMHFLIKAFYDSVLHDSPVPISYSEILRTSRIMDEIFFQVNSHRQGGSAVEGDRIESRSGIPAPE